MVSPNYQFSVDGSTTNRAKTLKVYMKQEFYMCVPKLIIRKSYMKVRTLLYSAIVEQ